MSYRKGFYKPHPDQTAHPHELIEGQPIGICKIIKGDMRTFNVTQLDGTQVTRQMSNGSLLYDIQDERKRSYFIICLRTTS